MEMNDIQRLLNLNKQVSEGTARPAATMQNNDYITSGSDISSMDDAVFGAYVPTEGESHGGGWDAKTAFNKMKEGNAAPRQGIKESKIPAAILDSILKNPLNEMHVEDDIDNFVNNAGIVPENIKAALDINKRMDNASQRQSLNEEYVPQAPVSGTTDIAALEEMIERVLDRKLSQLQNGMLTEGKNMMTESIKGFKINKDGKFFFLASNDDLYECQMKYLGKNKKKKQ